MNQAMKVETAVEELFQEFKQKRPLELFAEVPCPMKQRFRSAYEQFEHSYYEKNGKQFYTFVPTTCPAGIQIDETARDLMAAETLDDLPDICVSYGLEAFSTPKIREAFISKGAFQSVIDVSGIQFLDQDEFRDPYHCYNTIGCFPQVMLIDRKKLGDRPVPKSWKDLMNPVYKGCLSLPSGHGAIETTLLMHIYKEFGDEGIKAIEHNIKVSMGGAMAARTAGTNKPESAAIYVMPWIFAAGAVKGDQIFIAWPEEGILVEPILLMVKSSLKEEQKPLLDFMLSKEVSEIFSDNFFLSTHPEVDPKLPKGVKVKWLGWEYVFENDMVSIYNMLTERFYKYLPEEHKKQ
jgi:ABC-type Fe3+ transport system substrate-binding protein